jgi:crooked neck
MEKWQQDLAKQNKAAEPRTGSRVGHTTTVKSRAPAAVQITAEQIMREAQTFVENPFEAPRQTIADGDELQDYRAEQRKKFEDSIRRTRMNIGTWIKYAAWEAAQKQFDRARSVYERALDIDYRNPGLWLKYAEMEMSNRFINHARNVWDRVVSLLPRVDQFWYKYSYMEEMLGNVAGARKVFERWMEWQPDYNAWTSYIKLELRHNNVQHARDLYERFLIAHADVDVYLRYARFEQRYGSAERCRKVFERSLDELGDDANEERLFIAFAQFEEQLKEYERVRVIYRYALDHMPRHRAQQLYATYTQFEKQHGDKQGVEDVILSKRRFHYEEQLKANTHNYDVWFDYVRLEEGNGDKAKIREVYERAIANVPPVKEKRFWKRYIYLWINFALYEELEAGDAQRTREVYTEALRLVPHTDFTFAKLWLLAADFEVRCKQLDAARKLLGTALGKCPREKVFQGYIALELKLGNVDRCRRLYEKHLEWAPENCAAWVRFARLEGSLGEHERARAIFRLATGQQVLDMPEVLWKAFIDFEIELQAHDNVRALYAQLLERTKHVKVWISRAQFEASINDTDRARAVFEQGDAFFKKQGDAKEQRVMLLESWRDFERNYGTAATAAAAKERMPRRIKKRRAIKGEDGMDAGWEEYYDFIFPDEEGKQANLKLLAMAAKWKKQKVATTAE